MKPRVLAIAAHPDDIEFVMSGTLMRLASAGYELHYLNVANGCCGSMETDAEATATIRTGEARRAAESIGAVFHESLCRDLEIFYDRATLTRLAAVVRLVDPRIVLTHSPQDYMEDHMNTCRLAVTAAFARGMPNYPVDPPTPHVSGEVTVYHAQPHGNRDALGRVVHPDLFADVTGLVERKADMLSHHASQKAWLDASQGFDSYIRAMTDLNAEVGRMSGRFQYAEGWRRHLHLGFCSAAADPLRDALGEACIVAE